jgi:hypothetical protein
MRNRQITILSVLWRKSATVSSYDVWSSVTNYDIINYTRTRTDFRTRVRQPLVPIYPQTINLDVVFLSLARLILSFPKKLSLAHSCHLFYISATVAATNSIV